MISNKNTTTILAYTANIKEMTFSPLEKYAGFGEEL